jgi:hypothetical protein
MDKSLNVFVCSTYRDLVSERNAVLDALEGLADQFGNLNFFCPRSIPSLESAKEEIRRSDVLVLILGNLQGVIAPGMDIPHGEAEYNEGSAQGKKVLAYLRHPKTGLYPAHFERDPARAAQLKSFRDRLETHHDAKVFDDIASLVAMIKLDLVRHAQDAGLKPSAGSKTAKFKARSWETRRVPAMSGPAPVQLLQEDAQTRTIPMLQKALSTPFRRRRAVHLPLGRSVTLAVITLALVGFALAKMKVLPFLKITHQDLPDAHSGTAAAASAPGSVQPGATGAAAAPGSPSAIDANAIAMQPSAGPAPAKASGSVAVTDDDDSIKVLLRKAVTGTAEEQYQVGEMYEEGRDVPKSDESAFKWYRKAAEKGFAEAQYKIALLYRIGKGTTKSSYQAAHWFQAAAEQGHPKAQFKLGQMYRSGKGVERNETTAFKWFLKAADQKDPDAEKIIAELKEN